jgi:hypothetical protein
MARPAKSIALRLVFIVALAPLLIGMGPFTPVAFAAAEPRSLTPSSSLAAANDVQYRLQFTTENTNTVGSLALMFCGNTALLDESCDPPAGFDASNTTIVGANGITGFSLYSGSTANVIILTRPPGTVNAGANSYYDFNQITNPTNGGPLFARVYLYASSDGTGPYSDAGGMALYIQGSVGVTAEVPPYLTFCLGENISGLDCNTATEPFSDLGSMTPAITSAAQHQLLVATNAANGYSMWVLGTPMTSGSNVITPMAGSPSQKGTSQFGINLRSNTAPVVGQDATGPGFAAVTANYNQQNIFRFNSGDTLASAAVPDDYRKYTVSYVVNVPAGQPGGVYSTTLVYVCLANF